MHYYTNPCVAWNVTDLSTGAMTWGKICYVGGSFKPSGAGASLFSIGSLTAPYMMYSVIQPHLIVVLAGTNTWLPTRFDSSYNIISSTQNDWYSTYKGNLMYFSFSYIMS